jgi:hypothetical protein
LARVFSFDATNLNGLIACKRDQALLSLLVPDPGAEKCREGLFLKAGGTIALAAGLETDPLPAHVPTGR